MATTKKPVARKAPVKTAKTTTKVSAKKGFSAQSLVKEKNPELHRVTGKYKFLYILFMCTTIFFAALSVWLFCFSTETLNKYESIKACARAHTRCDVRYEDGKINVIEGTSENE